MGNHSIFPQYDVKTDPFTAIFIVSARFSTLGFSSIAALNFSRDAMGRQLDFGTSD